MRLNFTQQKKLHKTLATLANHWDDQSVPESLREYALSEGPHHLMMAGKLDKAISMLTDYAAVHASIKQNGSDGWMDDLQTVYLSNKRGLDVNDATALSVWHDFAKSNAHLLRRGDEIWPTYKILLQLAYEHADDSPVTAAAEEWIAKGHCDWLWLYDAQRPKHIVNNAFRVVYDGHSKNWPHIISDIGNGRFLSWTDQEVIIWEKATGRLIAKMEGKCINNVLVDQTCSRIAFWQNNGIFSPPYLYDLDDGSLIQPLSTGDQDSTFGGVFLDRRLITWTYSDSDEPRACLFLWDAVTGNLLHKHEANYPNTLSDENALQIITPERFISMDHASSRCAVVWALDNDSLRELAALHECVPETERDGWQSFKVLDNKSVLGRHKNGVFLFDSQSGDLKAHLAFSNILEADMVDDGRVLLRKPKSIKVWSPQCSDAKAVRTIHKGAVNSLSYVHVCDSDHVWIHAKNGLLWHTHLNGDIPPKSFEISDGWFVNRFGVNESGAEYVVSVSVEKIVCIDAITEQVHYSVDFASSLTNTNIFIDGWQTLTWHKDGAIMAWHPDSAIPTSVGKHNQPIKYAYLFSETLAVSWTADGEVKIWRKQLDAWGKEPFALYKVPPDVFNNNKYRFCANGDLIATLGDDRILVRWTKSAGTSPQLLYSEKQELSFELSENEDEIFVSTSEGELACISLTAIDPKMSLQAVQEFTFSEFKLISHGKGVVFSKQTAAIGLWDIDQQRLLHWFDNPFPEKGFKRFQLLAENKVLGYSEYGLVIWDFLNKSPCLTFQTEDIYEQLILPLQDGRVVVASKSGVNVLNPNSNQVPELFTGYPRPKRNVESRGFIVQGMLCSPDQASLIIWGGDSILRPPEEIDDPSYEWYGLLCLNLNNNDREALSMRTQGCPIQASFLKDNKVVTLSQLKRPGKRHCDLELWDLNTGFRIAHRYFESHSSPYMLVTNDGNIFYWAWDDLHSSQFEWWSPSVNETRVLGGHTDSIKGVIPLGEHSVLSWSEQELFIWNTRTGSISAGPKQFELKIQDIKVTPGVAFSDSFKMFDSNFFSITVFGERDAEVNCIGPGIRDQEGWHWLNPDQFYFDMVNLRNDTLLLGYDKVLTMTANDASIGKSLTLQVDKFNNGVTGYARNRYVTDDNGDEWMTGGDSGFASHIEWVGKARDILEISGKEAVVLTDLSVVKLRVFNDHLVV